MKLKPLGDRLIVRAIEEEETTAGGILLPGLPGRSLRRARVLAVGDGKISGGTEAKVDGEKLPVLRESDVLANVQP